VWDRQFILTTDFSLTALGAVLSQIDTETGLEYPVAYASRVLTPAETRYAPTEGEMLALTWGIEKFKYYLVGRKFVVHTDHHALQWLNTARYSNSKVERWALKLQEMQFEVQYKRGIDNAVADHLSRSVAVNFAQVLCCKPDNFDAQLTQVLVAVPAAERAMSWPEQAGRQAELDAVACTICHDTAGHDNMVICESCQRCFHLRCLTPPACSVPQGDWFCPGCQPMLQVSDELLMPDTPLCYRNGDIYLDLPLMSYVYKGTMPSDPATARRVAERAQRDIRKQAMEPYWPIIRYKPREQPDRWVLCPPVYFRWDLIRVFHSDLLAHSGVEQTLAAMHQHLHWPGIKADIASYIKCCDSCQRHKLILPAEPAPLPPAIYGPLRHVHIDLAGPFTASIVPDFVAANLEQSTATAKAYIVIMVDYFTKIAEFAVIYGKKSSAIARAVWNAWLCRYGVPDYITCDNARDFEGDFARMLHRQGIKTIKITALHPAANGAAERLVRSLKAMLTQYVNDHPAHWIQSLPTVRMAYMSRLHSTLQVTPSQMLMGFNPKPPTTVSRLFAAGTTPTLVASASASASASGPPRSHPPVAAGASVALAPRHSGMPQLCSLSAQQMPAVAPAEDQLAIYLDQATEAEVAAAYAARLGDYINYLDGLADAALRRHSSKLASRWLHRQWKAKRGTATLAVDDLVLELVEPPHGAFRHNVLGPFKIVGFTNQHQNVAVLQTGTTSFRDSQQYTRHISRLAKYFTIKDICQ
jgi:hypothetical protein